MLSRGRPATASSVENGGTPASAAFDGDGGTRWSSAFADPQWLQVDLGSTHSVSRARLVWETAYAAAYQLRASTDGSTWTTVYATTAGRGGTEEIGFAATPARYLRFYGTGRATVWGYSLWEMEVYGV
ncbi:discoidin domain-containing protein [Kitasatospora sp. NBC_00315]